MPKKENFIDIQINKNGNPLMIFSTRTIPDGAQFRECYETEKEIIVLGLPEQDDENHNCDEMGCSTGSHVLYRFKK